MSTLSVVTNCLLIGFTSNTLEQYGVDSNFERLLIVVVSEHLIFLIKFVLAVIVPDVPQWVGDEIARIAFVQGKAEEEEEKLHATHDVGEADWSDNEASDSEGFDDASEGEQLL
eukprot:TRINITY_DN6126_c0_g1_i1.p2 TRINITY_DN6126_c0_g1~~TRINITY_DN6126_c0_g1_i1.p2  ORF type:complete len:127 (+),score=24.59 TRINITY_DN6126_c0_g1_i1:41-382(+)